MPYHIKVPVNLQRSELRMMSDVLNEVCNGFEIRDFNATIGSSIDCAKALHEKITKLYRSSQDFKISFELSPQEVAILKNAVLATITELESELETRVGATTGELRNAMANIQNQTKLFS